MQKKKYQIRKALGMYWILDMEADGLNYRTPPCLNETGLYIWKKAAEGKTQEAIAADLSRDFGVGKEEAIVDVRYFLDAMKQSDIL